MWTGAMVGMLAAMQNYKLQEQHARMRMEAISNYYKLKPKPILHHDKCTSCGSREFKEHHGRTICSYCRGETM